MRSVAIGGFILLLLLLTVLAAAHAVPRRSTAAGASPGPFGRGVDTRVRLEPRPATRCGLQDRPL